MLLTAGFSFSNCLLNTQQRHVHINIDGYGSEAAGYCVCFVFFVTAFWDGTLLAFEQRSGPGWIEESRGALETFDPSRSGDIGYHLFLPFLISTPKPPHSSLHPPYPGNPIETETETETATGLDAPSIIHRSPTYV